MCERKQAQKVAFMRQIDVVGSDVSIVEYLADVVQSQHEAEYAAGQSQGKIAGFASVVSVYPPSPPPPPPPRVATDGSLHRHTFAVIPLTCAVRARTRRAKARQIRATVDCGPCSVIQLSALIRCASSKRSTPAYWRQPLPPAFSTLAHFRRHCPLPHANI